MVRGFPFSRSEDYETLRKRWLNRYLRVQRPVDTRLRTALIEAAEDASDQITALEAKRTFSSGVKTAQLRLVMSVVRETLKDFFKKELVIVKDGQRLSASAAVDAFTETDRDYLEKAFAESARVSGQRHSVSAFVEGQRHSAMLGVAHTVSRIYKSEQPLSARVYKTRSLANHWVQNQVNIGLTQNESAKKIATRVRKSIRPNTPGGVSYAAMRLGRTEVNNAFHATSVSLAQDRPWIEGMEWHLSAVHEPEIINGLPEICERYAGQVFDLDNVPNKPHPQCRCFVTPEVEPYDTFLSHLTAGQYRDWIRDAA